MTIPWLGRVSTLLAVALLLPTPAFGEPAAPSVRFQSLSQTDGLSNNRIFEILQDGQGFLWFATQKGLNRYDGHRIEQFLQQRDDPEALADDYIFNLVPGEDDVLWLGTKSGGVHRLDLRTKTFERFGFDAENQLDPRLTELRCFYQDPEHIWLTSSQGLFRLNPVTASIDRVDAVSQLASSFVFEVEPNLLWLATDEGIQELDLATGDLRPPAAIQAEPSLAHSNINSILRDRSGVLWIASSSGLSRLDRAGAVREYMSSQLIEMIYEDRAGRIWVATIGEGLALFRPEHDDFIHYRHDPLDPYSLASDLVFSIFEDRDGLLWVGTNAGVSVLERSRQAFTVHQRDPQHPAAGSYTNIVALESDRDSQLWIGTLGEGLIRLDPDRRRPKRFRWDAQSPAGLSDDFVWDLHADREGSLWIATDTGLDRIPSHELSSHDPDFVSLQPDPDNPDSLPAGRVLTLIERRNGGLWIGTSGGLSRWSPGSESFRTYLPDPERLDSLTESPILALHEDPSGILWIGLDGGGLDRFDPRTESFTHYLHRDNDPRSLGGNIVTAIRQGPDGALWIASYGGGLERFHPDQDLFVDVLPAGFASNPSVSNLFEDRTGALWFTMGADAFRYQPDSQKLTAFNPSDGRVKVFPPKSGLRMPDGELLFGGSAGFVSIVPELLAPYDRPPPVAITDFRILDRQVDIGEWRSGTVTLTHEDRLFWVDFAALHYADPTKSLYKYRLEGLSEGWVDADASNPSAQFSSLKAGAYTFQVQASHKDGAWNEEGASLEIVVLPPPWRSSWAYGFYSLTLGAIAWAYARSQRLKLARERAIAKRERAASQRLLKVDQLKDEFLANTSHELRTPLYGITGLAESLADGATGELPEATKSNLAMIVACGRRLSQLVGNILDFSRLRHDGLELSLQPVDLRALAEVVLPLLRPLTIDTDLELLNNISAELPPAEADESRLQQIFYNLVGNAIKFTDSGRIEVGAAVGTEGQSGLLIVSVRDTGIGIAEADLQRIFEPFEQADGSAERVFGGTGLGLALSHRLVEAHGGTLWATSTPGLGSTFSFSLPLSTREESRDADPIPIDALETTEEPSAPASSNRRDDESSSGREILIVDDEKVNRQVLVGHLAAHGYTAITASTGEQALRKLQESSIDLVLLDVMMPKMTGYEVCKRIRERHSLEELPVVFLTARSQTTDRLLGLDVGANDFLVKPIAKHELLARVKIHLQLLDAHRLLEGQVAEKAEEARILRGLLPICTSCKNIRDDTGGWHQMEAYIDRHSEASFSHGICPSCVERIYPNVELKKTRR